MAKFKKTLAAFAMPAVALIAAAVTCFFVPFDKQYLDYFDFRTLACLFCTLAVVCAFKNIRFFRWLADVIVRRFKTVRGAVIALVFVTYFGSMIMANDMALITFLPLGFLVLESCAQRKYLAFVFVMQNVAANLGGMLTPFGNPQNLYLYSFYSYSAGEFFRVMAVPFAVAFILILASCLFVKPLKIEAVSTQVPRPPLFKTVAYSVLFAVSVLIVFRVFPYWWGLSAVVAALLLLDPASLVKVDYKLLVTFAAFFVFRRQYGAHRSGKGIFKLFGGGFSFACGSRVLSGVEQRACVHAAFPFHRRQKRLAYCRKHRRTRHSRRVACKSDYAWRIPLRKRRRHSALSRFVFRNQFFVSCNPDGGFAVDFAAAVNAFTPPCCVKIAGKVRL